MSTSKLIFLKQKDFEKDPKLKKFANPKTYKSQFSKKYGSKKEVVDAVNAWRKSQTLPAPPKPTPVKFKAVLLTPKLLESIRKIHESTVPHVEVVNQELTLASFLGALHTSMTIMAYLQIKSEYSKRKQQAAGNIIRLASVEKAWNNHVQAALGYLHKNGLPTLTAQDLEKQAKVLTATPSRYTAVANIYNSAVDVQQVAAGSSLNVGWLEAAGSLTNTEPNDVVTTSSDLCNNPMTWNFTREFSASFAMTVSIPYWCPTWSNPSRMCRKKITVAGASFKMGLNISYRLDCQGFMAYGCAYASACVTVVSLDFCASCAGCVEAVAAVGTSNPAAGNCAYGAGAMAYITCKLAGITVFYTGVALGLVVHAPCLPA